MHSSLAKHAAETADGVGKSLTAAAVVREHGGSGAGALVGLEVRPIPISTASSAAAAEKPPTISESRGRDHPSLQPIHDGRRARCDGLRAPGSTPPSPLTAKSGAERLLGSTPIPCLSTLGTGADKDRPGGGEGSAYVISPLSVGFDCVRTTHATSPRGFDA